MKSQGLFTLKNNGKIIIIKQIHFKMLSAAVVICTLSVKTDFCAIN